MQTPISSSTGRSETPARTSKFARAAATSLLCKIPLVAIGVLNSSGIAGLVPPTQIGIGLYLSLAFLASSIVFLWRAHWFGGLSAAAYGIYTTIGGALLMAAYPWWGSAIVLTSVLCLIFTVVAFLRGEFRPAA